MAKKPTTYKCSPCRLGWHERYYTCSCKYVWETPTWKIVKTKSTNIERYGCENPSQNSAIKEKIHKTNIERYGHSSVLQNDVIKEKIKATNLERYGHENPLQNDVIKEKIKATNIDRYGHENPFGNTTIQEKIKATNTNKYGTTIGKNKYIIDQLYLINDKDWLFEQYIVKNKSALQIATELGISDGTIGRYLRQHEIAIRYTTGYSIACIRWLESIMESENIFIQHAANGDEYIIPATRYKADGYCVETNTIYEFHGDCFHGNRDIFAPDEYCHPYEKLTAAELYNKTIERENEIKSLGYNLVVMWENDFKKHHKLL